jgi:sortase A
MTRWMQRVLLLTGVFCLGSSVSVWLDASLYQANQGEQLDRLLATGVDRAIPQDRAAVDDALVGRLEIPRLGISAIVAEGADAGTLGRAVGHLPGTALPGEPGNAVLAGHRDTFFRPLEKAQPQDRLRVTTPRGRFDYEVDAVYVVDPDALDVLTPSQAPGITLITCYPFRYIGPAPRRFIVHARQVRGADDAS